jgi:hypothetical protein
MAFEGVTRSPLTWPRGVRRTPAQERKPHHTWERMDFNKVANMVRNELRMLGADRFILSSNQPMRNDGMPYAQERNIADPGVSLWFTLNGKQICLPCDKWASVKQNIRAIAIHLESVRGQERWGVGTMEQAFSGYAALPANAGDGLPWRDVLGFREGVAIPASSVEAAFKSLAKKYHPDLPTGDAAKMQQLNRAREEALAEIGGA